MKKIHMITGSEYTKEPFSIDFAPFSKMGGKLEAEEVYFEGVLTGWSLKWMSTTHHLNSNEF